MQRSVLTLLDFSKAYDTIWIEKLLLHMLDTGIPSTFIRWIQSFFNDRRARVQLFNFVSSSRCLTQGLPQGSVLAPQLFLFYINNLASSVNDDAVIALFADGILILKKEDVEVAAQSVVNSVLIWSQEWKLNLNADKSDVCPFSVFTGTQKICVNVTPRLSGQEPYA